MFRALPYAAALAACLSSAQAGPTAQVSSTLPKTASNPVDKGFLALGIETTSFTHYTGSKAEPNTFSLNLFQELRSRLGSLPIRVGGTSGDNAFWNKTQQAAVYYPDGDGRGLESKLSLGQDFMDSFPLIAGAKYDLVVPLENRNLSNAVEFAQDWYRTVGRDGFGSLEIGNEPNEYYFKGPDGHKYDVQDYVQQWSEWVNALRGNITDLPAGANFWALSLAYGAPASWKVKPAWAAGLSRNVDEIQAVSEHYYQTGTLNKGNPLQDSLLNHATTQRMIDGLFADQVSFLAQSTGGRVPLFLGEVGNALGNGTGNPLLQASLGSAVWTVDFLLTAMAAGIGRVNMQMIAHSPFSGWQPEAAYNVSRIGDDGVIRNVTSPAQVLGTFYGELLVADLLGSVGAANGTEGENKRSPVDASASGSNGTAGGATGTAGLRVAELDMQDATVGNGSVVGYAAYDADRLSRVILLNEELWRPSYGSPRPTANVTLTLSSLDGDETPAREETATHIASASASASASADANAITSTAAANSPSHSSLSTHRANGPSYSSTGPRTVTVRYLTGPDGGSNANMSWAGQAYTAASQGRPVALRNDTLLLPVRNGAVRVPVRATEVAVVYF